MLAPYATVRLLAAALLVAPLIGYDSSSAPSSNVATARDERVSI
jgi:hypothetical protein